MTAGELSTDVAVAPPAPTAAPPVPAPAAHPTKAHPSWHPEVLDGPLSTRALLRVDEALRLADAATGLTFSVYIGDLGDTPRDTAEHLLGQLSEPDTGVLVAVSPNERQLEIVTGSIARRRILDRDAKLAALSMAASFAGGDLAGGVLSGLDQLASHAGRH